MARYENSAAVRLEAAERVRPVRRVQPRRSFEVVEGSGLDARARQGVGVDFLYRVKLIVLSAALLMGLGIVRVGLCSQTVSALQATATLRAEIKSAQALEDELKVEHSVMYSSVRIERIATQNYGMVQATETETILIEDRPAEEEAADQGLFVPDAGVDQSDVDGSAEAGLIDFGM